MKRTIILVLAGPILSSCTTTRVDDHSYRLNDSPPSVQHVTYNTHTTTIKQTPPESPKPKTIGEIDREFLQYKQNTKIYQTPPASIPPFHKYYPSQELEPTPKPKPIGYMVDPELCYNPAPGVYIPRSSSHYFQPKPIYAQP